MPKSEKYITNTDGDNTDAKGRYHWIDESYSRRLPIWMGKNFANSKRAMVLFGCVALSGIIAGTVFLYMVPPPKQTQNPVRSISTRVKKFTIDENFDLKIPGTLAIATGESGVFFVATAGEVIAYSNNSDQAVQKESWSLPSPEIDKIEEPFRALYYVSRSWTDNPFAGQLIVATNNQIFYRNIGVVSSTSTENTANIDNDKTLNPSAESWVELELPLVENPMIRSITATTDYLFLADYKNQLIIRVRDHEPHSQLIIGRPDDENIGGFPGFQLAKQPDFGISATATGKLLYATNSSLFRVEAFDCHSGQWVKSSSWGEGPWSNTGFTGCCNPVGIATPTDGTLLTSEKGKNPLVRHYSTNGRLLGQVNDSSKTIPLDGRQHLQIAIATDQALLVLAPDGRITRYLSPVR